MTTETTGVAGLADLLDGDGPLISLAAAARLLPGRGANHPSPSCMSRWIGRGVRGVDGQVHRLQAVRVGAYWRTTAAAVRRFVAATSRPAGASPEAELRTPAERSRASARAAAELAAMGI